MKLEIELSEEEKVILIAALQDYAEDERTIVTMGRPNCEIAEGLLEKIDPKGEYK